VTKLATDIAAHRYKRHRFPAGINVSFQTVSEWATKFSRKFAIIFGGDREATLPTNGILTR
jgi:hypothetical protein